MNAFWGHTNTDKEGYTASILASAKLSDSIHGEIGVGRQDFDNGGAKQTAALAGIYYMPVDQLTIGLEAEHDFNDDDPDANFLGFVSVWSF